MSDYLETTIDKFTFRVDTSCLYSKDGIWVRLENGKARLGLSDFLQQRSGDIAFADVKQVGTILTLDDEFASIETVKANVMLASPVFGKVVMVNELLETKPEIINQDPFGQGWVCDVAVSNWATDSQHLLSASDYFEAMKREAAEAQK